MQPSTAGKLDEARSAGAATIPHARAVALAAGFIAVFLLLDWASYIRPFEGLNITPWNPHPALAIALLLWRPRWWALVWATLVLAEVAIRGAPGDWLVALAANAALALSYAAIAQAIARRATHTQPLRGRRGVLELSAIVIAGSLLNGLVYLGTLEAGGRGPADAFFAALARYWIGDAVGLLVLLPALLLSMNAGGRAGLAAVLRRRDAWLIAAVVLALLLAVFGRELGDRFKYSYLLFVPVVWAAARLGLAGAVLAAAITQVGLIVAVQSVPHTDLTVFELQVLMAAMTLTGLMLGAAVDERERASAELKSSLRLAAAGQMAAALAHELVQPLTALNSYAQASRLLIDARDVPDAERLERLVDISQRMGDDALRASDVVKRLRDFFRTGSTQLRPASVAALVDEAVAAAARRADALGVRIEARADAPLPEVLLDRVQISVVLRNLVANALDAASTSGGRSVRVQAGLRERAIAVEVIDSGPGVDAARLHTLFEPGQSDKPGGMGVGLSICRAIVEAHGGALWCEPGPVGHFCFTLPLTGPAHAGEQHAP
jgi:signal transduction histidine kinase